MANLAQAIRMALHYGEENLGLNDVYGEDVGPPLGGVFTATQGLRKSWNSPLDERGIIGMALGLAMTGSRCVAEIQFCDYIFNTIDLLKLAGNTNWSSYGQFDLPMTVMTPVGSGIQGSIYHSHSVDAWATRLAGWKVVMPSNPLDAYGLMIACLKENNPVLYLKPKALMRVRSDELIPGEPEQWKDLKAMIDKPVKNAEKWKPKWPDLTDYTVPIGEGKICREGEQATIVSYGRTLPLCVKVAEQLAEEGRSVEVIDMRSLFPYDWQMIKNSIEKTKRVIFVNEDTEVTNFGEHLLRRTVEELFYSLEAKPRVLAGKHIPGIGLHPILEAASVPQSEDILREVRDLLEEVP